MQQSVQVGDEVRQKNLDYTMFTWGAQKGLNPVDIESAKGVYIYSRQGQRILDFSSQLMNVNIGHNDPRIKEAIMKQMDSVSYVCSKFMTQPRGELGARLAQISPGSMKKTFFTSAGAESIENAIKLARLYTGKHKIIARHRSYHGSSYGALAAGGDPRKLNFDRDLMPSVVHVEDPYCYRCPWSQEQGSCKYECVAHIERTIQFEGPENIAAILMEGESGTSGCIKYPPKYWQKIRALADKYNILIISDEIMSGFGRCGQWFAIENGGVEPDLMTIAKGLTGGYVPMGGVVMSEKVAQYFEENPCCVGNTYSGHPLCCAVANAAIDIIEQDQLIENTRKMGLYIEAQVEKLKQKHPSIGDFRNTGLLGCIELVKNRETREPIAPFNASGDQLEITNKIVASLNKQGLFTFVRWNYIFTAPPLTVTAEQIDEGLNIISNAISIADQAYH